MPYQREWLIENQVLYTKLWGEQTLDEIKQANHDILTVLKEIQGRPIHVVTDASELHGVSINLFELHKYLTYTHHQNVGWTILFGVQQQRSLTVAMKNFVRSRLAKLSLMRYVRVGTFDEAIAYLLNVDSLLDWDKVNPDIHSTAALN